MNETNGDSYETLKDYWRLMRSMETHETQRDYWRLMRLRVTTGDS